MQTRSQSKQLRPVESIIDSSIDVSMNIQSQPIVLLQPPLLRTKSMHNHNLVIIDFDEASRQWNANKKKTSNGCYKYVCGAQLLNDLYCKRKSCNTSNFCSLHKNVMNKITS